MSSTSSSSWRKPITQWLENVCAYYFGSKKDESSVAVVDHALSLIEAFMKKDPQHAKQQWQNLAMAAFLTSVDLLDLSVDTKPLWEKCDQTCDPKRVKELQKQLLGHPETAPATPAATPKKPATPAATPKQLPTPAPTPKIRSPSSFSTAPPTPIPIPHLPDEKKIEEEPELEEPEEPESDSDTLSEVPDEEVEQQETRARVQKEKANEAYIHYVHDESMLRVWPYVFDVELNAKVLNCLSRIFRTYAINLAKKPQSKHDIQNIAAGTLLAALEHIHRLPHVKPERLIAKLYDDYPLSSKRGIKEAWEALKATPDLLATKCKELALATPKP